MKIFIDFDDVIFNTKRFSAELRSFFQARGISEEMFTKYYYSENFNAMKVFDPWGMMDRVQEKEGIDTGKIRESFEKILCDLDSYIFDDVQDFLASVGKENVYLVSYGLAEMQNKKIAGCHVDEMVKKCVVVDNLKAQAISCVIDEENLPMEEEMFFIDDRAEQIADVKKKFPNIRTLLLCRKEGRYCDKKIGECDYEIHNLDEAREIIKNICR